MRHFADIAEHPRAIGAVRLKKLDRQRNEFLRQAWAKYEKFLAEAAAAYILRRKVDGQPSLVAETTTAASEAPKFTRLLRAAMRMPQAESLFPAPLTAAARRMLPSPSPQFTATAMWGPVLAWCALELLAEWIDDKHPEPTALDLFDRLRLREPFARALAALGFEGEEAWRVAARIKVLLLVSAGIGKESAEANNEDAANGKPRVPVAATAKPTGPAATSAKPATSTQSSPAYADKLALPPALWLDPDVRWLCGVHQDGGHVYLVRESYEELLWWLLMPSLLRIAGETVPSRAEVAELSKAVAAAMARAHAAGYRIDPEPATIKPSTPDKKPTSAPAKTRARRPNPAPAKTQAKQPAPPVTKTQAKPPAPASAKKSLKKPARKPKK